MNLKTVYVCYKEIMRIITWNVNGIRSILGKAKDGSKTGTKSKNALIDLLTELAPDVLCLQEIKCSVEHFTGVGPEAGSLGADYKYCYTSCAMKKGYSGTCIISRLPPVKVHDFVIEGREHIQGVDVAKNEGRVICMEFANVCVINVYTPNSKQDLSRLEFRVKEWDMTFRKYVQKVQNNSGKPVVVCGDFNVAPNEIDVHNPKSAKGDHGFTMEERASFETLLHDAGLVDSFRFLHPEKKDSYSWFSPFAQSRSRNKGWRIDHILVSKGIKGKISAGTIHNDFFGSDHVPCSVDINI